MGVWCFTSVCSHIFSLLNLLFKSGWCLHAGGRARLWERKVERENCKTVGWCCCHPGLLASPVSMWTVNRLLGFTVLHPVLVFFFHLRPKARENPKADRLVIFCQIIQIACCNIRCMVSILLLWSVLASQGSWFICNRLELKQKQSWRRRSCGWKMHSMQQRFVYVPLLLLVYS